MKIRLSVYSTKNLELKERIKYLKKAFNSQTENRKGYLSKFINAIGYENFSPLESSPGYALYSGIYFLNEKDEIITFVVNKTSEDYDMLDIMIQLQNFLYKIFPNQIRIELTQMKDFEISVVNYCISYFTQCIAMGENIDTTTSIPKLLSKKEERKVLNFIRPLVQYEPEIHQFLCKTCFEYHPKCPYHIELTSKEMKKKEDILSIEYGYYQNAFLKEEELSKRELYNKLMEFKEKEKQ